MDDIKNGPPSVDGAGEGSGIQDPGNYNAESWGYLPALEGKSLPDYCLYKIPHGDDARQYDEHDAATDSGDLDGEPMAAPEPPALTTPAEYARAMAADDADPLALEAKFQGLDRPFTPILPDRPEPAAALVEVPLGDVMSAAPLPLKFAVSPWLPRRHTTLLGGHGGIGKSAWALAMAAHVAAGRVFAGHEVERSVVLFVSLEDEPSIVKARLRRIIEAYGLDPAEVLENMRLLDGTRGSSALMTEGAGFGAAPIFTKAFCELIDHAQGAGLIIVDNASDAFAANENARREVRAFVRGLAALARKHDAAVVLLAHIDKAAARNGSQGNSYSGSTAWHNSARSRLALTERDGSIVLLHEKANLSALADPLRLAFVGGVLMPCASGGSSGIAQEEFDQAEIIRALLAAREAGIDVPTSLTPGAHSAMQALAPLPEYCQTFKGAAGGRRAAAALTALRRAGRVRSETYRTAQRKERERLVVARAES